MEDAGINSPHIFPNRTVALRRFLWFSMIVGAVTSTLGEIECGTFDGEGCEFSKVKGSVGQPEL